MFFVNLQLSTSFLYIFLLVQSILYVHGTKINHTGTFDCAISDYIYRFKLGPNFENIPPAKDVNESIHTLHDREQRILEYYARRALPQNISDDDHHKDDDTLFIENPTNPFWNSRSDTSRIVSKMISRIILGCYNNTIIDEIFADPRTRPFAISGTSQHSGMCYRDGDYDFASLDLVQLLYVSREYPNSMSTELYSLIRDTLLTITGPIYDNVADEWNCSIGDSGKIITFHAETTENHKLQTQVSRYLTNQLLHEVWPHDSQYNNTENGNTEWMLSYLSSFLRTYFYEYNSHPYQLFTVKALSILYSYAQDDNIVMLTEMILDIITSYSSIQMNHLRRFVPYRRQPKYAQYNDSWAGDGEFYRLAVLVGDYATLDAPKYILPGHIFQDGYSLGNENLVSTVASHYRIKNVILQSFFRTEPEYMISKHHIVEMYYSSKNVLISAGGNTIDGKVPDIDFPTRKCSLRSQTSCMWDDGNVHKVTDAIKNIIMHVADEERGWSRPTTIVPSNEHSMDIRDMVQFVGYRNNNNNNNHAQNLCVGPGFACGLQLNYGNIITPIILDCSITYGDWRFFDFSYHHNNNLCPKYGYYMAVYVRSCHMDCYHTADNYGIIEIVEDTDMISYSDFQHTTVFNNPNTFSVRGIQSYQTIHNTTILFEIDPIYGNTNIIDGTIVQPSSMDGTQRNYLISWPNMLVHSKFLQSGISSFGRWTIENDQMDHQRMIYDTCRTTSIPQMIVTSIPNIIHSSLLGSSSSSSEIINNSNNNGNQVISSYYFDDQYNIMKNDSISTIAITYTPLCVSSITIGWFGTMNTLDSTTHGTINRHHARGELYMQPNEYITEIGIGSTSSNPPRTSLFWDVLYHIIFPNRYHTENNCINHIRIETNYGQQLMVGSGIQYEEHIYTFKNNNDEGTLLSMAFSSNSNNTTIVSEQQQLSSSSQGQQLLRMVAFYGYIAVNRFNNSNDTSILQLGVIMEQH